LNPHGPETNAGLSCGEFLGRNPQRRRREEVAGGEEAGARLGGAAQIDRFPDARLFLRGEAAPQVEGVTRVFRPLAERGVPDTLQMLAGDALQVGGRKAPGNRSRGGVPDRPAVALLDSLVARVHGEHDRRAPAGAEDEVAEPRVRRLEGEPAVIFERRFVVRVHVVSFGRGLRAARIRGRASASHVQSTQSRQSQTRTPGVISTGRGNFPSRTRRLSVLLLMRR
jgi:hypothetical protein